MERECGECSVCCYVGEIPELNKPPHTLCQYVKTNTCGSCSIWNSKKKPQVCDDFRCSWRYNIGHEKDRPDKNRVLFSTSLIENQGYGVAVEISENAITTTGKNMAIDYATKQKLPIIVVKNGMKPPDDTGDYIIIHDDILHKTGMIRGKIIERLSEKVAMYELIKGKNNGNSSSSI
jgi:hypothetical protein